MAQRTTLPECCRTVTRQAFRSVTPSEPGELGSCLNLAELLPQSCRDVVGQEPRGLRFGPTSTPTLADLGRFAQALADFDPSWPILTDFDQHRTTFGKPRLESVNVGQYVAKIARPVLVKCLPILVQFG